MVLLENFWDEVLAGPAHPDQGMSKTNTKPLKLKRYEEGEGSTTMSMPESPTTPATPPPTPSSARKENVWRSVFNPGSNPATKGIGAALFDKPPTKHPYCYDWLYSDDTGSKHR